MSGDKFCTKCERTLPLANFGTNNATSSKKHYWCLRCTAQMLRTRRNADKEKTRTAEGRYRAKMRENFDYRLKALLYTSRARSLTKGLAHSLTLDDLKMLFPVDGKCPVFGFLLEWNSDGFRETSPSIDRIDSTKGYTLDNVQIISWKANRLKSYATVDELETVLNFLKAGG